MIDMAFWCWGWETRAGVWFLVWATCVLVTDRPGFVLAVEGRKPGSPGA